jgi:hypothetical protein
MPPQAAGDRYRTQPQRLLFLPGLVLTAIDRPCALIDNHLAAAP